jgi:hypothetical protein
LDASQEFTGAKLRFAVAGEGVSIDPATGLLSIDTDRLAGVTVTVTATNAAGSAVSRFRLTVASAESAPGLVTAPGLSGNGAIGAPVTVDPGIWSGEPAPELAFQWLLDGAPVAGETAASYVPQPADDGRALACRVTATNIGGSAEAVTAALAVAYAVPEVTGSLADLACDAGSGPVHVEAAVAFAGDALTFAVSGAGATIDTASGVVTIPTDGLLDQERITVTASNSGGSATTGFAVTVRATVPVAPPSPMLSGSGVIGEPVTVDPGIWGGVPAPELALQWLCDGAAISGATAASYTPQPADDGKALACRVTATNAAGSAEAVTAAIAVTHAPPVVVASLADVSLTEGDAPRVVDARPAFAGEALSFTVSGGGASVDAEGLISVPATAAGSDTVTVTATNSGGSATTAFEARVVEGVVPPRLVTAPVLAGSGVIGEPVKVSGAAWSGAPAPVESYQWLCDGAAISGATSASYTPQPADDGKALACRVIATNAAGKAEAVTAAIAVAYARPVVVASLADVSLTEGDAPRVVDARPAFAGEALSFTVSGGGASVDAEGLVSVPATSAGSDTVTVTATNSGGSATTAFEARVAARIVLPLLVAAPVLAGSGVIGEPVKVSGAVWSGVPAPAESYQWLCDGAAISGATVASYTPQPADDGKALACRVTATNLGGKAEAVTASLAVTYAPPVAKGELLEEIFDLGSGVQTVAAAADFTGEALVFSVTGAKATIDAKTGVVSIPTDAAVQATVTVTATNSGGSATSSFQVTVEAEDIPFALEADDVEIVTSVWRPDAQETWFTPVVNFPGLAGETVDAIEWTTSVKDPIPETEVEVVTKVGSNRYQLYMRDSAKNAPGASPRVDYSVFKLDETNRREVLRFRWRRTAEGPWSALSPALSVPAVPAGDWPSHQRFVLRSEAQETIGEPGGTCMQFPRCVDAEGDYVHMAYDVTWPSESVDFGDDWTSDECRGLFASQSCMGICVDGKYVHGMFSSLFMANANSSYGAAEGIYRKNRETNQWDRTQPLSDVYGSNGGGMRYNMHYIAKVAGSGSGPDTRTLFAVHAPRPPSGSFSSMQIYKSTNGGTSWATDGGSLATGTYGVPIGLFADSTALYLYTKDGVWRRPIGGSTWTKATGLTSDTVTHLEKHGSKVYASVQGQGLYTANDATTLSFSRLYQYDIRMFSVCPTDTNKIIVLGGGASPKKTTNGGSSWTDVASQPYDGQPNNFAHKLNGPPVWIKWHDTDPDRAIAMRQQHMGKSTDGGNTFVWASRNLDYSEVRSIGFHRTDYQRMFLGMTDRLLLCAEHGAAFVIDDNITESKKTEIDTALGGSLSAYTAAGTLLLDRGAQTGYVAHVGNHIGSKTPVISSRGVTTTETDKPTTGNGAISITASPDLPAGTYTLTCTTSASNGGTFTGVGPLGVSLGTWTVGAARTYTHPRGGTLAVTISDGSVDFSAGANPKVFKIFVNPIASQTVLNPGTKNASFFGQANPEVGYRGISGRHVFEMDADGSISLVRTIAYPFQGYMGGDGNVVLATTGNSTLMRSTDEGKSFSTWASGLGNFSGRGIPIVTASSHDTQRAYVGTADGMVKKIQNGTPKTVFSFDQWCTDNKISGDWPGNAQVNGRFVPPVSGIAESFYDPNLLYCCVYLFGAQYQMFRTENALAASPTWECITPPDGLAGPLQGMSIHPLTDEPVITSSHGTVWYKPKATHLAAYSITNSIIDDLRTGRGGKYWRTAKV